MANLVKVFVYGTLKTNEANHHLIADLSNGHAQLVGLGETMEKYPLTIATRYNIPFLLNVPGKGHCVTGEIYAVDDVKLKQLDAFEGVPRFYQRIELDVAMANGSIEKCWTYVLNKYPEELLSEHRLLSSYTGSTAAYVSPSERGDILAVNDLNYSHD